MRARQFLPLARPTARVAVGRPSVWASCAYDHVSPGGIVRSSAHTSYSNADPFVAKGTVNFVAVPSKYSFNSLPIFSRCELLAGTTAHLSDHQARDFALNARSKKSSR